MVYPEAPTLWLAVDTFLSVFSHGLSYVCVVPVTSSSCQNSSHIGLVSLLWSHLTLITSLFFILFYWNVIAFQYCVIVCYT